MGCATAQKMPVAILGHPARAGQVGGPDSLGLLGPISAFGVGIKEAQIGDEVLLVVAGEDAAGGSSIRYWRIELGWLHGSALRG